MPPMKVTKYSALLALLMTSGLVHAQTNVDQVITAPTWNAANSTDLYAETVASLNATGLTPAEIAANAVNDAFAAAVTTLNEDESTPGSAAFYRAARIALDADPTNVVRQAELARAQILYSTNLTTVTNLEAAAEVDGVSINTFSGASGQDVIGINLDDSEGAAAVALAAAQEASNAIEGILDYYGEGAGATTTEESFADLEGEVIDPLRDLVASDPALDADNDGFLDADAINVTTAADNLAIAEANYQTVASDPTSTQVDIAIAAGSLAGAQTAFATSVVTLYNNFSPITEPTKEALLGSVLNGSWERDAIKSSAEGLAQETADRAAADAAIQADVDQNELDSDAADAAIRTEFAAADTTERNARTAADTAIRGEFAAADTALGTAVRSEFAAADTTERDARTAADTAIRGEFAAADTALGTAVRSEFAAADTALGGRIDSEISARIAGDTAVRTEFAVADTALGTAVRSEFAAADTTERNARIAGDSRLQSNIDENTRGIAMVAAMTNTTVDIGKTHAVDFNLAQFQSETGFAFGYVNRINENVQVHTSVASTTDFDESVVRLGVAVQW